MLELTLVVLVVGLGLSYSDSRRLWARIHAIEDLILAKAKLEGDLPK
jgi:hypothetical protein